MSLRSVLPLASMSCELTTWIGLALVAFGEAMRDPVMTISSTSGAVALAGGGACALAAPARHTAAALIVARSEEHTSELQSQSNLVCRLLLEKKKNKNTSHTIASIS